MKMVELFSFPVYGDTAFKNVQKVFDEQGVTYVATDMDTSSSIFASNKVNSAKIVVMRPQHPIVIEDLFKFVVKWDSMIDACKGAAGLSDEQVDALKKADKTKLYLTVNKLTETLAGIYHKTIAIVMSKYAETAMKNPEGFSKTIIKVEMGTTEVYGIEKDFINLIFSDCTTQMIDVSLANLFGNETDTEKEMYDVSKEFADQLREMDNDDFKHKVVVSLAQYLRSCQIDSHVVDDVMVKVADVFSHTDDIRSRKIFEES